MFVGPGSDVARASLACLYLMRERLLPDLLAELPRNAGELNRMVASHRHDWLGRAMPAAALPEPLLLSNIAAFLVHAGEERNLPDGEMESLFNAWFEDETSILCGHRSRRHLKKGVFVRRYCCVRYRVPGQKKCGTCPLSAGRTTGSPL
jgi:hypothetical protein